MNELNKRGRRPVPRLVKNERLRKLIDEKANMGIPREKIAEEFGCDTSTITKHYNDNSPVDVEFLYKYAKYFNVSADYLLGFSDVKSADPDDRAICEKIGCSEDTYIALKNLFNNNSLEESDSSSQIDVFLSQSFAIQKAVFDCFFVNNSVENAVTLRMNNIESLFSNFNQLLSEAVMMKFLELSFNEQCDPNSVITPEISRKNLYIQLSEYNLTKAMPFVIEQCAKSISKKYYIDFNDKWIIKEKQTGKSLFFNEKNSADYKEGVPLIFTQIYIDNINDIRTLIKIMDAKEDNNDEQNDNSEEKD